MVAIISVVCILGGPFLCGIFAIVCGTIEKVSRQRAEASIKLQMLQKGFTASDIERVLASTSGKKSSESAPKETEQWKPIAPTKPI